MINPQIDTTQWRVRIAIQRLHKIYNKTPWVFMTETDVQCSLYAELIKLISKKRKVIVRDAKGKLVQEWEYQVLTRSLHAELSSSRRRSTEYVDLCLINPSSTEFWIKKRKFSRGERVFPVWDWDWSPQDSVGIEIKFNKWRSKTISYNRKTSRESVNQGWINYRRGLIRDMKKLKRYKRGWLVFVDQHSLIPNYEEWRKFMDDVIRDSNYGYAKKTLNAYYLCPKLKRALSYKSPGRSF